ncbi:MAG: hypothetical protein HY763_15675 [Planctomycetes bacterium]|nr:hypothetical protein [Planctomycetota bacterium]
MIRGYETQEYAVDVAGITVRLLGPREPHALHRLRPDAPPEEAPYWAQLWPAGLMLVDYVASACPRTARPLLELGGGLGLAGIALTMLGYGVIVTDYDEEALEFARASAELNGVTLRDVRRLDWRHPPAERFTTIVASDVVYHPRNHLPIAGLLSACLERGGRAYISDINRPAADRFPDCLRPSGFTVEVVPARSRAIPAFDARDGRILNGRVFVVRAPGDGP